MEPRTLLIATADPERCAFLAAQLDADGHTVHQADHTAAAIAKLAAHAIDVLILGNLDHPAQSPALLRHPGRGASQDPSRSAGDHARRRRRADRTAGV